MLEKIFKLKENGTDVKTEVIAGFTTFMSMVYIVALNPNLLTGFASPEMGGQQLWNAVFLATCIGAAFGTILLAFFANKPFALAPGMGTNSLFAVVAANIATVAGVGYLQGFQAGLCIVLIEGIVFLIISVLKVRDQIINAIPLGIRLGISPAIGLMLMNIGFGSNAGVGFKADGSQYFIMSDFFGALSAKNFMAELGENWPLMILTVATIFIGILVIVFLRHLKAKGAVLYGMIIASIIYWESEIVFLGVNPFAGLATANWIPSFSDLGALTLLKFDFKTLGSLGLLSIATLILTFFVVDMYDTIGTLIGVAGKAEILDEDGCFKGMKECLITDAASTVVGACVGTSTVTTYIESSSGAEAGGRTGLAAIVTGLMFLVCMFIEPLFALIPSAATSSALIYVGTLMLHGLTKIDLSDVSNSIPVFVMLLAMPVSGSISNGIGLALITYSGIKVVTGKSNDVSWLTWIASVIFLIKFLFV